jgi:hypothetical protein
MLVLPKVNYPICRGMCPHKHGRLMWHHLRERHTLAPPPLALTETPRPNMQPHGRAAPAAFGPREQQLSVTAQR